MVVIDTSGLFNNNHRRWDLYHGEKDGYPLYCLDCHKKNINDSILEMVLRLHIIYKLQIENDNFSRLFNKHEGIKFKLIHQKDIINNKNIKNESELVGWYLSKKLILGVGFTLETATTTSSPSSSFTIPILKEGKMWQLLMNKIFKQRDETWVDRAEWFSFKWFSLKYCLFCHDYPRDLYPGNFVINQNILYMKSFIWVDKRKIHIKNVKRRGIVTTTTFSKTEEGSGGGGGDKKQKKFIMYNGSTIISWPFLENYYHHHHHTIDTNALNNMAIYSMGDIFISFIDILIARLKKINIQNEIIMKLKPFYKNKYNASFSTLGIKIQDLINMYKICKRKKRYEIFNDNMIKCKNPLQK